MTEFSTEDQPAMRDDAVIGAADQYPRLRTFRERYPEIVIGTLGRGGPWQARIPEECGETVVTRYTLRDLLNRLEELTGGGPHVKP
jgi:hypothetical protein